MQASPDASVDSDDGLWCCLFANVVMLHAVAKYIHGAAVDAKWRLCADGAPMHALLVFLQRRGPKPTEWHQGQVEFAMGYRHHDAFEALICVSNRDNYWVRAVSGLSDGVPFAS